MPKNVKRRKTIDISHMEISPLYYAGRAVTTLLRWLFLLAVAFIILYPLVYMLSMAFRSPKDAGHAQLSANEEFRFFWPLRPA